MITTLDSLMERKTVLLYELHQLEELIKKRHIELMHRSCMSELSAREKEILALIQYENLTNIEIAKRLGLTVRGVKYHVSKLLRKFGKKKRFGLLPIS